MNVYLSRLKDLAIKLLSIKGLCALTATAALMMGKIDGLSFLLAWGLVIGGRAIEKLRGCQKA